MNSLDSAFCKKCGADLPADDIQFAREKLEAQVADGFRLFNAGRSDEAMLIAEGAVASNPVSTAALSLKAMCHERMGQISEALECHERVLEIDPDSMIDRIKANDLRNRLVRKQDVAVVPDRRVAIMGAAAAVVLVASIGVLLARQTKPMEKGQQVAMNTPATDPSKEIQRFESMTSQQQPNPATTATPPGVQPNNGGQTNAPAANQAPPTPSASSNGGTTLPKYEDMGGRLPGAGNGGSISGPIGPIVFRPDQVPNHGTNKPPVGQGTASGNRGNDGPDPQPIPDQPRQDPPRENPGIMDIKIISRNGKPTGEAPDNGMSVNGVEALSRTARQQYQVGNYAAAAQSWERALRAGAPAASSNQRLAQCYEKLGKNSEAVSAYNRAIAALESELAGGRGDKDRINAALDTCRQAVKVLGG